MLVNRSSISRVALPQTSAEWEQVFARCVAAFAKVPLSTWQFLARFLLVLSLSVSLARLFWLVLPAPVIPAATVAIPTTAAHLDTNNAGVDIAQLKSLAIFGKAAPPKQEQPAVIEAQTVTQLNLVLVGVIVSSDESAARAMIASGDKQDVYAINAPLPVGNNVTLSKIMNDRVIINNNGQYESLLLYQDDPNAPPISQAAAPQAVQQIAPPQTNPYPSGRPGPEPEMQTPQPERNGGVEPTPQGMEQVSRNLSDVLAMSIQRENGQVIGYKIRPGRDAEKFKSLGLQTDDIVTAINGMPLTNPAKIMEVYKNMGNTTSASLEIKRGGSVITVDVVLQ